jgi:hypothetical protein
LVIDGPLKGMSMEKQRINYTCKNIIIFGVPLLSEKP